MTLREVFELDEVVKLLLSSHGISEQDHYEIVLPLTLTSFYVNDNEVPSELRTKLDERLNGSSWLKNRSSEECVNVHFTTSGNIVLSKNKRGIMAYSTFVRDPIDFGGINTTPTGDILDVRERGLGFVCKETTAYLSQVFARHMESVRDFNAKLENQEDIVYWIRKTEDADVKVIKKN